MLLRFDKADFLRNYWQKKPLLLRNGLADFADLIAPELLAGLAMEETVDARVIQQTSAGWLVEHGPFESYDKFGETDWTLLVQAVNEWFPEVEALLEAFRFLPDWRTDDVMVSFATENGSVGAHLDQYDVFIIQGGGRRHWRVGERTSGLAEYCPHADLKQLKNADFTAVIDEVLSPGDVLYIPAGCPHHGVALEPSINYSVGFRAPNSAEWFAQIADQLLATDHVFRRYQDPELQTETPTFEVTQKEIEQVRDLLKAELDSDESCAAILRVMSQSKRPLASAETPPSATDLITYAASEMLIGRTPGARILRGPNGDLYANGELLPKLSDNAENMLLNLREEVLLSDCDPLLHNGEACACTAELIAQGVLYLVQEIDEDDADDVHG